MTRRGYRSVAWIVVLGVLLGGGLAEAREFVVGILSLSPTMEPAIEGLMEELTELASQDKHITVSYVYNGPVGYLDGLSAAAENLLSSGIDVLFALTTPATLAAKAATEADPIPVVFTVVNDPVGEGIVESLRAPGENVTGVRVGGSMGKVLEWLMTIAPDVRVVFVPHNPRDGGSVSGIAELTPAADLLGIELLIHEVTTADDLLAALADVPEEADALLLNSSGFLNAEVDAYVAAALERKIPLASVCACVDSGVLLSYGHDYRRDGEQAARLVWQILRGAAPGDLPVETADFFLGINLRTAEAIDLVIDDDVLDQADYIAR